MKFYTRELPEKKYSCQKNNIPSEKITMSLIPGDRLCAKQYDYHIDRIEYSKNDFKIYATKTKLSIPRKREFIKRKYEKL